MDDATLVIAQVGELDAGAGHAVGVVLADDEVLAVDADGGAVPGGVGVLDWRASWAVSSSMPSIWFIMFSFSGAVPRLGQSSKVAMTRRYSSMSPLVPR